MKIIRLSFTCACLLLLCSCATHPPTAIAPATELPAPVAMNKDAGRGDWVVVTIRLGDGEKLPVMIDTGAPLTVFDNSLEPKLGRRLGSLTIWHFADSFRSPTFAMPRLYLGNVLLETDTNDVVITTDVKKLLPGEPRKVMGVLGMDVLGHYCVQMDFKKRQIRFLEDRGQNKRDWGRPFPLHKTIYGCFAISQNFVGAKGSSSLLDTGANNDGWLIPSLFNQWTNEALRPANGQVRSPTGVLGGEIYHDLDLDASSNDFNSGDPDRMLNGIGLRVLSENLVTFDFPNKVMYLKRVSEVPLASRELKAMAKLAAKSAFTYLRQLKLQGRLPGFSKTDKGTLTSGVFRNDGDFETFGFHATKRGEPLIYHYTLIRKHGKARWRLEKAWKADQKGHKIEEYPIR